MNGNLNRLDLTDAANLCGIAPRDLEAAVEAGILGRDVEFRRTRYDFNDAIERIRASGCPNAEDLFVESILHPPDETLMTETYEKVALGRRPTSAT